MQPCRIALYTGHLPTGAAFPDRVKTYEAKLAALNAVNSALQKENEQLREDLEDAMQPKTDAGESDVSLKLA